MRVAVIVLLIVVPLISCEKQENKESNTVIENEEQQPQAVSLLGDKLYEPERSEEAQARLNENLKEAKEQLANDSTEMNYIWYGRRMAYLTRYNEAIDVYTEALMKYPNSYKLYRHRGHRYISTRKFNLAIADLEKAEELMPKDTIEVEPDGIPNKINQPLSSTQFNVYYHLALAHYLKGDFEAALEVYENCLNVSVNDDLKTATLDWYYMTTQRLGAGDEADTLLNAINTDMNIIENDSYYNRLLMYKGKLKPEDLLAVSDDSTDPALAIATQGYGVGNWYLYQGDTTKAKEIFQQVVDGEYWSAFGYIAAEADLARLKQ